MYKPIKRKGEYTIKNSLFAKLIRTKLWNAQKDPKDSQDNRVNRQYFHLGCRQYTKPNKNI